MKKLLVIIAVVVGLIILVGAIIAGEYNSLVKMSEQVENSQAQVESVLQRRYDLIPNLVESVKGAMAQEERIFTEIADARTKYGSATSGSQEKIDAANDLESSIARLLVVIENYPELKSNDNVRALMDELAGTENRIAVERKRYNDDVKDYNAKVKSFPSNLIAKIFGFEAREYFEAVEDASVAPVVSFD